MSDADEGLGPELFFGIAGAVGTDLDAVCAVLARALEDVGYEAKEIRLSALLDLIDWSTLPDPPSIDDGSHDRHIDTRMEAGDRFREGLGRGDALAMLAILKIREVREAASGHPLVPTRRVAYVFRSLKHPQEVETLREVYGPNFFLVSAYSPAETRAEFLAAKIAHDREREASEYERSPKGTAWDLIARDQAEANRRYGQKLGATFPMADFFVDARDHKRLNTELTRFVELLFNHPFHTPTRAENAMFHAQAAALRSAAPGRQVGAVITTVDGSIVAVGSNEVPKVGGGQYWEDDAYDQRDHNRDDRDVSGTEKETVIDQILRRLKERDWLKPGDGKKDLAAFKGLLEGLRVHQLIEFERAVHAEMSAITDAARRGVPVANCHLFTTTFPCHECTRHVIAAGIIELVYIEPYPKSLAARLHDDAIAIDPDDKPEGKVVFTPFVGVAPRRYLELFTPAPDARKDEFGKVREPKAGYQPKGVPGA